MAIPAILGAALSFAARAAATGGRAFVGAAGAVGRAASAGGSLGEMTAAGRMGGATTAARRASEAAAQAAKANPTQANIDRAKKLADASREAEKSQKKYAESIDHTRDRVNAFVTQTKAQTESWLGPGAFVKWAEPARNLVAANNPAVAERFALAADDAYGVIGRMLIPALESATNAVRQLGDAYARNEQAFRPFVRGISVMFEHWGNAAANFLDKGAPFIEMMGELAYAFSEATGILIEAVSKLGNALGWVARQFGYTTKPNEGASSFGAGARQVRFQAPTDVSNEAIKSALMAGNSGYKKPEEYLSNMDNKLGSILTAIQEQNRIKTGANPMQVWMTN